MRLARQTAHRPRTIPCSRRLRRIIWRRLAAAGSAGRWRRAKVLPILERTRELFPPVDLVHGFHQGTRHLSPEEDLALASIAVAAPGLAAFVFGAADFHGELPGCQISFWPRIAGVVRPRTELLP